jgi:hypothetical protein
MSRAAAGVLLASLVSGLPTTALADETAAEQLFQEGLAALKRNDYAVACDAFAASNKADPSPGTQLNLALCFEKQKKWASSWTWYRSAVGLSQQRGQRERAQAAEEGATKMKLLLHYVVISVHEPLTELVVKRDGAEVTTTLAGKDVPLPVDPGEHTIEVNARGKKPWSTVLKVADDTAIDHIEVPKLEDTTAPARPGPAPKTEAGPMAPPTDGSGQRTVGIIVGGAGLVAGIAGGVLLGLASSQTSNRDKWRQDAATRVVGEGPTSQNVINDNASAEGYNKAAQNDQLIAAVCGAGALVLVGVGLVLYLTAPKGPAKTAATTVVPSLHPAFGGLRATF